MEKLKIEDTNELRAIYKFGDIVLFAPKDADFDDINLDVIQMDFGSKKYQIYNGQRLLKFTPYVPIENDTHVQDYFVGLIYKKIPASVVFSFMRHYTYKPVETDK